MPHRTLASAAIVIAGGAAWLAAGWAAFPVLLWVLLLVVVLALPPRRRTLVPTAWLLIGTGVVLLSWVVALDHEAAFRHGVLLLAATLVFAVARAGMAGRGAIGGVAVAVTLTSLVALGQVLGGLEAAQARVATLAPALREAAAARLTVGRAFGTASLPGHFAILLVTMLPLLVAAAQRTRGARRWAWWGVTVLGVAGIVVTQSLAAAGVGLVLVAVAARHRRTVTAVGAIGVLAVAAVLVVLSRSDLAALEPLQLRWVNWRTAAWVVAHHPLTGVGLGGVGQAGLLAPTGAANISPFTHCTPLQLVAELGIAGLGLVTLGGAALVGLLRRGWRHDPALTLAVAAVPLHNLVDFSFYAPEVLLPWAVLGGTLAGRCLAPPRRPVAAAVLIPVLVAGTLASALAWRGEAAVNEALARRPGEQPLALSAAARWQPWAITPLLAAADAVLRSGDAAAAEAVVIDLERRWWVRPASSAWAEALARLDLAAGRPDRALPWALEARRRAPWRAELGALEARCRRGS